MVVFACQGLIAAAATGMLFVYFVRQTLGQPVKVVCHIKEEQDNMSVDQAFRRMIRREIEAQLRPLRGVVTRLQEGASNLGALKSLADNLSPLATLFTGGSGSSVLRRGPGRPPGSTRVSRRGRRPGTANDRGCAIKGCRNPSRTKGYCAAHYQKLRMLARTNRRPSSWADYAPPGSVNDVVLPRGRAAAKALKAARAGKR